MRLTLEVSWEAWAQALTHQLSYRVIRVPKRKRRAGRRGTGGGVDDTQSSVFDGGSKQSIFDAESKMSAFSRQNSKELDQPSAIQDGQSGLQDGQSGIPGMADLIQNKPQLSKQKTSEEPGVADGGGVADGESA